MTNTTTTNWHNEWMETQRKYWQAWTDMGLSTMGQKIPGASPWEGALDHWWGRLASTAPDTSKLFIDRLMDQSKHFLRMTDDLYRNLGAGVVGAEEWVAILQKTFSDQLQGFDANKNSPNEAMQHMLAFWEAPFDNWQRVVASMSMLPSTVLRNVPHEQLKEHLQRLLSVPGFGYMRETQDQYQDLVHHAILYQNALQEYTQFFSNLGIKSAQKMRERITELKNNGKTIDSARGLYDVWVECCEDVYAQQVMSTEYAQLHGKLVNSLMAFKQRMNAVVDESLSAMNMPTRAELRTLEDRLQETRRENKNLRRDVEALRKLVAALDAGTTPAPAVALAANATRTTAARHKTSPDESPEDE